MTSLLIEEEETQIKTRVVEHVAQSRYVQMIVAEKYLFHSQGIYLSGYFPSSASVKSGLHLPPTGSWRTQCFLVSQLTAWNGTSLLLCLVFRVVSSSCFCWQGNTLQLCCLHGGLWCQTHRRVAMDGQVRLGKHHSRCHNLCLCLNWLGVTVTAFLI